MDKQLAKDKLTALIDNGDLGAVTVIVDFLKGNVPEEDLNELVAFSTAKKEQYLNEAKVKEEQREAMWRDAQHRVREARFTWDEMMEVLEDAGGVIAFNPVGKTTLFSRYNQYGHLITTLGRDYYAPLAHKKEEILLKFKTYTYEIDSAYSKWNDLKIADYLKNRETAIV